MRVIAGKYRSLQLKTPKGNNTRPTLDRIKETLFNMIQNEVPGCIFVDAFAGSGAIGIEALSRGARHCYFIENNKEAYGCITDNLNFTHATNESTLLKNDILMSLSMINASHVDIFFLDPPYLEGYEEKVFSELKKMPYIDENTLIILEATLNNTFSFDGYEIIKEKRYKTNKHIFLRRN